MPARVTPVSLITTAMQRLRRSTLPAALLVASGAAHGAHPLITEDTGTQGAGKTQIEFTSEFGRERDGIRVNETQIALVFTRGITDTLDVAFTMPWQKVRTDDGAGWTAVRGAADADLTAKWRFYEQGDLSLALKPGIVFSTGDEQRGLGAGRTGASVYFVTSLQPAPWAWHLHMGYRYNRNDVGEREALWHLSTAVTYDIGPLKLVADLGTNRNPDPGTNRDPAFLVLGAIYSLREGFDLDLGYKLGLNDPETDRTILAGLTWRF